MKDAIAFVLGNFTLTFFVLGLRAAACFLWGAAGVHIFQMIKAHNFAPGNAGIILCADLLIPLVGLLFLWLQRRPASHVRRVESLGKAC